MVTLVIITTHLCPSFISEHEMWIVLLLRTSGECIEINFHFTDKWPFCMIYSSFFGTVGANGIIFVKHWFFPRQQMRYQPTDLNKNVLSCL